MAKLGEKTKLTPIYCAGLVDGEGCIHIRRTVKNGSATFTLACNVSNTYEPLLHLLKAKYGGAVHVYQRKGLLYEGRSRQGTWIVMGKEANAFIKRIAPYLIIKAEHAQLAMKFWAHKLPFHRTNQPKPHGFVEKCAKFHVALKALNQT